MNTTGIAIQQKKGEINADYLFQFYAQRHPSYPSQIYQKILISLNNKEIPNIKFVFSAVFL